MLKVIMKTSVTLCISLLYVRNVQSASLNYITLYGLREQHQFNDENRGKTNVEVNSSKRFMELYQALESDKIEDINKGVEDAYNHPYYIKALLSQSIVFKNFTLELKAQDFLVAEIHNPVFPELNLFNVRTDSTSIEKSFNYKEFNYKMKISYMNRWYINQVYSLEEIVTDDIELNLKRSKTYTPIYFDFLGFIKREKIKFGLMMNSVEVTRNDEYNYYETRGRIERVFGEKLKLFIETPLAYVGNYSIVDDVTFGINHNFLKNILLSGVFSKMKSEIRLDTFWENIFFETQILRVKKSYLEEKYINNLMLSFGFRY